jgi:integrase
MTNDLTTNQPGGLAITAPLPIDQNPAAVYLAGLGTKASARAQRAALATIADLLTGNPDPLAVQWGALRFQHTAAIRARLAESYSPATANRMLCALRGVLKAAWRLGQMTEEQRARAADLKSVRGETLLAGRMITPGELAALMAACENDPTPAGARDAAMIATMYPGGLRRDEVIGLDLADYNPQTGALTVRHGKGNKARITYLEPSAARALADWLAVRGDQPGALLWPIDKGGNLQPRRMTNQAVFNALAKRATEADITDITPHDLRRTFISNMLDAGADITTVAKLAGHKSVTTTARYDRRPEAAKAKAAGLLHLPYKGRAK